MRRWLKRIGLSVVALVILAAAALPPSWAQSHHRAPRTGAHRSHVRIDAGRLERRRYLTTSVSLCLACHSEIDWSSSRSNPMRGSGRSFADEGVPFLTVPNITPDEETGAGRWTDDMLARYSRRDRERRPYFFR